MSEHLSEDVLTELRQKLEEQRAKLSNSSKRALDEISEKKERGGKDSVDESTEEQGTSTMLRLKGRERKYLTKINTAIERINNDEYGYCLDCGEPIPEKRLRARPVTLFCIDCKEAREQREKKKQQKRRPGLMDDWN